MEHVPFNRAVKGFFTRGSGPFRFLQLGHETGRKGREKPHQGSLSGERERERERERKRKTPGDLNLRALSTTGNPNGYYSVRMAHLA